MAGAVLLHRSMSPAGLREGVEGTLVMCSMQEPIVSALLKLLILKYISENFGSPVKKRENTLN